VIGVRNDGARSCFAGRRVPRVHPVLADLLRSCKRRGMTAPVRAIGDGALGFWAAVRNMFPETREQPC
jgi:transposase-like protein